MLEENVGKHMSSYFKEKQLTPWSTGRTSLLAGTLEQFKQVCFSVYLTDEASSCLP